MFAFLDAVEADLVFVSFWKVVKHSNRQHFEGGRPNATLLGRSLEGIRGRHGYPMFSTHAIAGNR
jgi:hypothetical protein